jgi:cytochrome b subunit of formate dehydrogenase
VLKRTHVIVVVGLAALFVSGLLLFAADLETFVHSRVFWLKMVLLVMLLANGVVMLVAERRVRRGDVRAWRHLHTVAVSSLVLWFVTTLAGAALSNL